MRVSFLINDMMSTEADPVISDISQNKSEGRIFEILPYLSSIT